MADTTKKKNEKPIEEEGEEVEKEDDSIQNNKFLEGEVSSPFAEAESVDSAEDTAESSKVVPEKKQLDEAIVKQTSSTQKRVIKNYSRQRILVNHMAQMPAQNL